MSHPKHIMYRGARYVMALNEEEARSKAFGAVTAGWNVMIPALVEAFPDIPESEWDEAAGLDHAWDEVGTAVLAVVEKHYDMDDED